MGKDRSLEIVTLLENGKDMATDSCPSEFSICRLEVVASFSIFSDRKTAIWVFHNHIADVENLAQKRPAIQKFISDCCTRAGVPEDIVRNVLWIFDSDESVKLKTDGNYFLYMR